MERAEMENAEVSGDEDSEEEEEGMKFDAGDNEAEVSGDEEWDDWARYGEKLLYYTVTTTTSIIIESAIFC